MSRPTTLLPFLVRACGMALWILSLIVLILIMVGCRSVDTQTHRPQITARDNHVSGRLTIEYHYHADRTHTMSQQAADKDYRAAAAASVAGPGATSGPAEVSVSDAPESATVKESLIVQTPATPEEETADE